MSKESSLNPEIREVYVGVRHLRKVHIYPLSISDQEQLTNLIVTFADKFQNVDWNKIANDEALEVLKKIITDNLNKILEFVTDDDERPKLDEMTNNQFYEIINAIFEVNYEGLVKNMKDLFSRMKNLMVQQNQMKKTR